MANKLTDAQILQADITSLSLEEMQRRITMAQVRKAEEECEVVEHQNKKFQDEKIERARIAAARTLIIQDEAARTEQQRAACKHKSGGKGLAGFFNGDGGQGYTVATLQLPTSEIYFLCSRCQTEWHLPSKRAVLSGALTLKQYQAQEREYYEVQSWDKQLFEVDGGVPGSVLFRIPKLEAQKIKDDQEFSVYLECHGAAV